MRAALVMLTVLVVLAAGCGDGEPTATGVIIEVEASSLTEVDAFVLQTNDGERLSFGVAPDAQRDPQEGFVASHLRSHASLGEQVSIAYRSEDGQLLALTIEHAQE
jgi:hypothetical protein